MAEPDYTTYAKVRAVLSRMMTASSLTDAEILAKHDIYAKPPIDGALAGRGAPFTAGAAPSLVQSAATLMTAAGIFLDVFGKADKRSEIVDSWIETANGWISDMRSGAASPSGITTGGSVIVTDPASDKAETAVVVSDETEWEFPSEERES